MNYPPRSILIPIPSYGFDPTEVAVPWKRFIAENYKVIFATPHGKPGQTDIRILTGKDLGLLKNILMADQNGISAYTVLEHSYEFQNPIRYEEIQPEHFNALFLPGGHDKGMKEYLESAILQKIIIEFFAQNKPVGAICHGTLLAGRSISPKTGKSVLWGRKTTGLTAPQELMGYYLTCFYLGDYYRTYPITVEQELKTYLQDQNDFSRGPDFILPTKRDNPKNLNPGFALRDGNYLSARWPGDAHKFADEFVRLLKNSNTI